MRVLFCFRTGRHIPFGFAGGARRGQCPGAGQSQQPDDGGQRRRRALLHVAGFDRQAGFWHAGRRFHPQRMAARWFSTVYYNAPMPHAIFFYGGFAIHGSYDIARLGGPASHGCIRLHPNAAAILFDLVQRQGMRNTTIVVQ